jgi:hypothetical protein
MAIFVESITSYGTDDSAPMGFGHDIPCAAGAERMTLALFHSVSSDNASFTSLEVHGMALSFLDTLSSLRAGLYHRLDVYYADDDATGPAESKLICATSGVSMYNCSIVVMTFSGIRQQVPTNYGNIAEKAIESAAPAWIEIPVTSGSWGMSIRHADANLTPLAGSVDNIYGCVPAANESDTCQALLYLSDGTTGLLVSAVY